MKFSGKVDKGPRNRRLNVVGVPESRGTLTCLLPIIKAKIKGRGALIIMWGTELHGGGLRSLSTFFCLKAFTIMLHSCI